MMMRNAKLILIVFSFLTCSIQANWGEFFAMFLGPIAKDAYVRAQEEEKMKRLAELQRRFAEAERSNKEGSSGESSSNFFRFDSTENVDFSARSDITLKDVIGSVPEQLEQLSHILINGASLERTYGIKTPKGILLYGIPGTGKTYYAKALAGELKTPFIYRSATSFLNKWIGESPRIIRELFQEARKKALQTGSKVIIFIDEIDAIAKKREGHNGYDDVLNELLTQMDGFEGSDDIIVIGATNVRDRLDPAILRSGRLDYHIEVPMPDIESRKKLFSYYLKKFKAVSSSINVARCAQHELTPADIKNVVHQAMNKVAFAGKPQLTQSDLEAACADVRAKK